MTELTNTASAPVPAASEAKKELPVVTPNVDIMETDNLVSLIAEMPGVCEKNVDIDLQGNTLAIRGSTDLVVPDGMNLTCGEYNPNRVYERQFTLGDSIDLANITATMKDGILHLNLPKLKELAPRKIEIKTC